MTYVDLYLRLSDGRGLASMESRERALKAEAKRRGWQVRNVIVENDLSPGKSRNASAFKRRIITLPDGRRVKRTVRPGFRSVLDHLWCGQVQAMLAEDLDRVARDPRDGEDLIECIEMTKGTATSISGSLQLTEGGTDAEIGAFRDAVNHAWKSSRDTGRRVKIARVRQEEEGVFRGGRRPYGLLPVPQPDERWQNSRYTLVPEEVEELQRARLAAMVDVPLRSIVRDMIVREVPTVYGGSWTSKSLRTMLMRSLNLGKERLNEDGSVEVLIPAIFTRDERDALVDKLTAPARWVDRYGKVHQASRAQSGRGPRWLGTNLYHCVCGALVQTLGGTDRSPTYVCAAPRREGGIHVRRNAVQLDAYVREVVLERLKRPDARELITPPAGEGVDTAGLRVRAKKLRDKNAALVRMFNADTIDEGQLTAGTKENNAELERIDAELASANRVSPLAGLLDTDDVDAAWDALDLGRRRAVVAALMTITILPTARGRAREFDRSAIKIEPVR